MCTLVTLVFSQFCNYCSLFSLPKGTELKLTSIASHFQPRCLQVCYQPLSVFIEFSVLDIVYTGIYNLCASEEMPFIFQVYLFYNMYQYAN